MIHCFWVVKDMTRFVWLLEYGRLFWDFNFDSQALDLIFEFKEKLKTLDETRFIGKKHQLIP